MTEQFFWISKYGDAIYIGYGMEKIEELKIDFSNNKELEPLIIIQYVSEDCINSMVLLKDLNKACFIMGKTQYGTLPEVHKKHRIYSYLVDSILPSYKINSFFLYHIGKILIPFSQY